MVKSLASPPHRILLFLQQSSVEWCSSLWLDAIREIDPTFRRTVIVVSKFDNRLKVKSFSFFFFSLSFSEANLGLKEMNIVASRCIALIILLIVVYLLYTPTYGILLVNE